MRVGVQIILLAQYRTQKKLTQQFLLVLGQYGLAVVAFNVLLNQIGLPVPAVPTLVLAGAIAANGQLPLGQLFLAAVGACVVADCAWYGIGQKYGIRVLKTLCRISLEPDSCVSETESQFDRWGVNSLVIAKFVPGWATIAPPLAGAMRIGWLRFIFLSTLAAILWSGAGLLAGMLFNTQIARLLIRLDEIGSISLAAALLLLTAYVGYKWWGAQPLLQNAADGANQCRGTQRTDTKRRGAADHRCTLAHRQGARAALDSRSIAYFFAGRERAP